MRESQRWASRALLCAHLGTEKGTLHLCWIPVNSGPLPLALQGVGMPERLYRRRPASSQWIPKGTFVPSSPGSETLTRSIPGRRGYLCNTPSFRPLPPERAWLLEDTLRQLGLGTAHWNWAPE